MPQRIRSRFDLPRRLFAHPPKSLEISPTARLCRHRPYRGWQRSDAEASRWSDSSRSPYRRRSSMPRRDRQDTLGRTPPSTEVFAPKFKDGSLKNRSSAWTRNAWNIDAKDIVDLTPLVHDASYREVIGIAIEVPDQRELRLDDSLYDPKRCPNRAHCRFAPFTPFILQVLLPVSFDVKDAEVLISLTPGERFDPLRAPEPAEAPRPSSVELGAHRLGQRAPAFRLR